VVTFFFAIHPLHTVVVANAKSRDEILSLLLMLLTLNASLRSFDTRSRPASIAVPVESPELVNNPRQLATPQQRSETKASYS